MYTQYTQLEASLIRIFSSRVQDAVVGAGFLISPDTVLTCAHVVTAALDLPDETAEMPTDPVLLDFPIVQANEMLTAHACFWEPVAPNGGGDICVLQLEKRPPDGVKVARLVVAEDLWGHEFRAIGFPDYHPDGASISGKLKGRRATGRVQIEDVKEQGFRVQPGFSGGAVWDEQLDGVAGMIVEAEKDTISKVGYIIPADVLIKAYPPLGQQAIPACPYRGLFAFREEDAPYFFGRETFTRQLREAIRHRPLLAVVGSSGSGKSSVVFAGLLPLLRKEGSWLFASFRPGSRPFYSLAAALLPLLEPQKSETDRLIESNKLARGLEQGELALEDVLSLIMQKLIGTHLLLVADQFEELYTLCQEPALRQHFLDQLLRAVQALSGQGTVSFHLVLTLRADFVAQALTSRSFADALQYSDLKLGPMNIQELRAAIQEPAKKLHVSIEDGLTGRILRDVGQDPGRLPLLEFALTQLWDKQRDGRLTNAAYEEIGGVEKALADHAEEVYAGLNEDEQRRVENVFVQLVQPGSGTEDTRRLATRAQVGEANWVMVMRLSNARLVVTGRDATTGEETVEVIHEALIRGWQRLQDWIEANREFRLWQERLRNAQKQWQEKGKDPGALLRGALLVEAATWLAHHPEGINSAEQAFIEASQQHEQQEVQYLRQLLDEAERQRLRAEQQREEAQRQQRLAEERRREAEQHRQDAERQREEARRQQQIALARSLAAQAELLRDRYPHLLERSVLLAIEAMQRYPCLEADQAVQHGLDLLPRCLASLVHQDSVTAVAFSPDGQLLATASGNPWRGEGSAWVWEVGSGRQVAKLVHQGSVTAVAFSPDGQLLATTSEDRTAGVWEVSSGRQLARLAHQSSVRAVAFSPDGQVLATASGSTSGGESSAWVWEVNSGRQVAKLVHQGSVTAVAFSPDGQLLATASGDPLGGEGTAGVWEVSSGRQIAKLVHQGWVYGVAFSPDGWLLATASEDRTAGVWEVSSGRQLGTLAHQGSVMAVIFSPGGRLLATASGDPLGREGSAGVWEVNSGRQVARLVHQDSVNVVAFSPDGTLLATASSDRTAGVWEVSGGRQVARLVHQDSVNAVAFSRDGRLLATASSDRTAGVWEVSGGRQVARLVHQSNVSAVAFSPDGRLLATASWDRTAWAWEVSSGRQVARLAHQGSVWAVVFSPDGRLLATASEDKTAGVWEVSSGRQVARLSHRGSVEVVTFSPDGGLLAIASGDRTAGVWEVSSGRRVTTFAHQDSVTAVAFSPDGQLLATASSDNSAGVWEVLGGRQIVSLGHDEGVNDVAFSPDERYLATVSGNAARVWLWRPEDLIAEAQRRLTRNLTEEEWRQYLGDEPYRKTCPDLP